MYCPNGHQLSYTENELQKVQRLLAEEQVKRIEAEALAFKVEKQRRKLAKRISAGVCPCCNRTFQDLQRHMGTKHKDFALPPGAAKQITGAVQ